jgi:transposase InsO family protein
MRSLSTVSERVELVKKYHLFGHFGREAIFKKLWEDNYWWPNMRRDIEHELKNCDACVRFVVTKTGYHPFTAITADGPWTHIQIDCSVHLPLSSNGYTTLFVVIDVFTGFVILRPVKNSTGDTIARELWNIFCIMGLPKIIQSDNGPEFVNQVIVY